MDGTGEKHPLQPPQPTQRIGAGGGEARVWEGEARRQDRVWQRVPRRWLLTVRVVRLLPPLMLHFFHHHHHHHPRTLIERLLCAGHCAGRWAGEERVGGHRWVGAAIPALNLVSAGGGEGRGQIAENRKIL